MAKQLRVALIGYNFMGRAHSNAWRQAARFFPVKAEPVLKTICGRDKAAVAQAAAKFGWQDFCTDWGEVVEDPGIDVHARPPAGRQLRPASPFRQPAPRFHASASPSCAKTVRGSPPARGRPRASS